MKRSVWTLHSFPPRSMSMLFPGARCGSPPTTGEIDAADDSRRIDGGGCNCRESAHRRAFENDEVVSRPVLSLQPFERHHLDVPAQQRRAVYRNAHDIRLQLGWGLVRLRNRRRDDGSDGHDTEQTAYRVHGGPTIAVQAHGSGPRGAGSSEYVRPCRAQKNAGTRPAFLLMSSSDY